MGTFKQNEFLIKNSMEFPCSYIQGKLEKRIYINLNNHVNLQKMITEFTKRGFRRNHNHMYIPSCTNCNECISTRINIKKFFLSRSNKRNLKNNSDLFLISNTKYTHDRFLLFKEYCSVRHSSGQMQNMTENEFINFFHKSSNKTKIFDLINENNQLYGSILLDELEDGFSAVYSFFNPKEKKRSLGKNIILQTIRKLDELKNKYLYLGFWVKESRTMNYKSLFNHVEYFKGGTWTENL